MILLFHCDELHKVNLLNNGIRKAIACLIDEGFTMGTIALDDVESPGCGRLYCSESYSSK